MRWPLAALGPALTLAACGQGSDARVDALENRVSALELASDPMSNTATINLPVAPATQQFDLTVDWPGNSPPEHRLYPSREDCETARAAILMSNKQRRDSAVAEREQQKDEMEAEGGRVIYSAPAAPPLPTPLCIPA